MENKKINLDEGTIVFWIHANKVNFNDDKFTPLKNQDTEKGSIFILKDADNKIKFFYVYLGQGRTDIEWDCSNLDSSIKHMIAVTWSQSNKQIKLFVDGKLKDTSKIK